MRQGMRMRFPIAAVERHDAYIFRWRIQATYVHIHAIGIRTRNIEGFDAADFAEKMLCHTGVEGDVESKLMGNILIPIKKLIRRKKIV